VTVAADAGDESGASRDAAVDGGTRADATLGQDGGDAGLDSGS